MYWELSLQTNNLFFVCKGGGGVGVSSGGACVVGVV